MKSISIVESHLLLVEGRDEKNFFDALLKHMRLGPVQVEPFAGKTKLRDDLPLIAKTPGFTRVSRLAIIRDADDNAASAFQSVQDALRNSEIPCPGTLGEFTSDQKLAVGVFILPGRNEPGMLEDLCLSTVSGHPVLGCVEQYIECLRERVPDTSRYPSNESKARAHAFLAGMPKLVKSVGLAALRDYWDFKDPVLQDLKAFLKTLRN